MKILFLTTCNPTTQGDYLELSIIHGFRSILGKNFIDYPRKKILYQDFTESPKESLHGKGFTYCHKAIQDLERHDIKLHDFDIILMGSGHIYGEYWDLSVCTIPIFYTCGHDLYGNSSRKILYNNEYVIGTTYTEKCFKRELIETFPSVYPIGFGIPSYFISTFSNENRIQKYQSTAPTDACFFENSKYKFNDDESYIEDMKKSWFGLTCKKGGWDSLRHYEILASGAVLLFKDYDKKPDLCEPISLPTISYSTVEELNNIMDKLVINNNPTDEFIQLQHQQRDWLLSNGTCEARAKYMLNILEKYAK